MRKTTTVNMEIHSTKDNADNLLTSKWFCPHYGRETCTIHFKCCPESDRYLCHKCHNQFIAAQEEKRAKEQEENKLLIENPNIEEVEDVEEVFEQTTESTGLDASSATVASQAKDRTRKQEENKPLPEASEADEGLGGTSDGAGAGDNSADVAVQVEKRGSEGEENQKTLHKRLEIGNDEGIASISGEPQNFPDCLPTQNGANRASSEGPFGEITVSTCSVGTDENIASETSNRKAVPQNSQSRTLKPKDAESPHPKATALDGTDIKCTACGWIQMISKNCEKCMRSFADYYCGKCQLLIGYQVDPYHCDECKTCRTRKIIFIVPRATYAWRNL